MCISQVTIYFNVSDANDNRPIFNIPAGGYVASIPENATVGSEVITVMATDLDQGIHQSITYSVLSNTTSTTVPFQFRDPTVSTMNLLSIPKFFLHTLQRNYIEQTFIAVWH